jgi:thiol:disulfide interchange protein
MKSYGLDLPGRKDTGVGLRSGNLFYKMEGDFSMDNVRAFVEEYLAGKLVGKEQEVWYDVIWCDMWTMVMGSVNGFTEVVNVMIITMIITIVMCDLIVLWCKFDEPERGAPPSEEEDLGPTKVVTLDNSNFEDVVTKSTNDVMVEFYAPWCGHCKALKPEYHQLAEEFAEVRVV